MSYTIAVVIPAYNAQPFICEALDSVAAQRRKADQIIVVNDGSTDQTADIVCKWTNRTGVDVQLVQQENQGLPGARNTGIRHAKTDLIALLDADDLFLPHHLEHFERAFKSHSDIVLCFGDAQGFRSEEIAKESYFRGTLIETLQYDEDSHGLRLIRGSAYSSLIQGSYIPCCATLLLKKAAKSIQLFDEGLKRTQDRDFWLRLSRVGRFAYYPEFLARVRYHDNNLTHPRQLITCQRYRLMVLQKMIRIANELHLTPAELQHTINARNSHVYSMLYPASKEGLMPYLKTCLYLLRGGLLFPVCNPKHLLRASFSQLF